MWPADAVRGRGLAAAHHDRHSLYSRHVSHLLGPDLSGGHEVAAMHGAAALAGWEDADPVRVARCVWRARLVLPDGAPAEVVNGQMPRIERSFEEDGAVLVALRLRRAARRARSWTDLRRSFLGATDPRLAVAGSLRHDAARGLLPLTGVISLQNNAFHLSAGPLEAVREGFLWFQDLPPADPAAVRLAVDGRTPLGSAFEVTEGLDWDDGADTVAAALLATVPPYYHPEAVTGLRHPRDPR